MKMTNQSTSWCFTINNFTASTIEKVLEIPCRYIMFSEELGEGGTPHLQGWVWLNSKLRFGGVKKMFTNETHLEIAKGTFEENMTYIKKEGGKFYGVGDPPEPGKRSDILAVKKLFDAGGDLLDAFEENFGLTCRTYRGFEKYLALKAALPPRLVPPRVIWLWGGAGCGKTREAYDTGSNVFIKDGTKWWDGYKPGDRIVIDDFDGVWPYRDLLRLLDRYPYQGQVKGGYVNVNSSEIFITCEFQPDHFWSNRNELAQVMRRLSEVRRVLFTDLDPWGTIDMTEAAAEQQVSGNTSPTRENMATPAKAGE